MKVINIPTRVFAQGDRVLTPDGIATVLYDELEDFSMESLEAGQRADQALFQQTIIVQLDEPDDDYPDPGQDVHLGRACVSHLEHFKKTDQPERCRYCEAETNFVFSTPCWINLKTRDQIHTCLRCHRVYIVE